MPLNSKAIASNPSNQAIPSIQLYQVREVPLPNLQTWKHYVTYRNESRQLIESVSKGLKFHVPELMASGTGGAYLLRSEDGDLLAIFKPFDEDPFSLRNPKAPPSNPQMLMSSQSRPLIRPGEVAHREVAAYLLDRKNLAGVPLTTLVRMFGESRWGKDGKIGSLQSYVNHDHDSWELSSSLYTKSDVHNIALFDLRLLNTDRHGGNILVRRTSGSTANPSASSQGVSPDTIIKLIPIDHGFCLPDSLEGELWFEWMSWPQAKMSVDARLRRYIQEIDLEEDCCLLRALGLGEETVATMVFCSVMLQQALLQNLSPLQIAELLVRRDITNFLVENDNLVQVMRYHVEEMLNQIGGNSPPCIRRMTLTLDPRPPNTPKQRRQNSAPNLLDLKLVARSDCTIDC